MANRYEGRRYRLLSAHYTEEDKYLLGDKEADELIQLPVTGHELDADGQPVYNQDTGQPIVHRGTIVGKGTPHAWTRPPTQEMVGLDPESQKLVDEVVARAETLDPTDFLPLTVGPTLTRDQLEEQARAMGMRLEVDDAA